MPRAKSNLCSRCKTNQRHNANRYCKPCRNAYYHDLKNVNPEVWERLKEKRRVYNEQYRAKKKAEHIPKPPTVPKRHKEIFAALCANTDDCIIYGGSKSLVGYGQVQYKGKLWVAHRLVLTLALGRPIKPGYEATHSCDNRACISANHLREATHKQNMAEAKQRGRMYTGPRYAFRLLSDQDVRDVRKLYASNVPLATIAKTFDMPYLSIQKILQGKTYKEVA